MIRRARLTTCSPARVIRFRLLPFLREQLQAEFFFKQLELLADARLRSVKAIGGGRNVQAIIDNRQQVFELL